MAVFTDSEQFYATMRVLFDQIQVLDGSAAESLLRSRLLIRFRCTDPAAEVVIDARKRPLRTLFGANNDRPELDIELTTDMLHRILLGEVSLAKALGKKQLKVSGPVWKTIALADLFDHARRLYPRVLQEQGVTGG